MEFLGPINKAELSLNVSTLKELKEILKKDEEIKPWLESCAVALNDTLVSSLNISLKAGDKVSLLPPVCGGW